MWRRDNGPLVSGGDAGGRGTEQRREPGGAAARDRPSGSRRVSPGEVAVMPWMSGHGLAMPNAEDRKMKRAGVTFSDLFF